LLTRRCWLALALVAAGWSGQKSPHKGRSGAATALIAGTVFSEAGFRVPGAQIRVLACPSEPKPGGSKRETRVEGRSDARGEFALRVPAGPACYRLQAAAEGYVPFEQQLQIMGEEDLDLTIRLKPAAAPRGEER